jgi:hypothetical protein
MLGSRPGFIAVLVIAFILGVAVTEFCLRLKKWNDENKEDDL